MAFWNCIENEGALHQVLASSEEKPVFILKHSFRCALSAMAKNRIEKNADDRLVYSLVDVVKDREISNMLSEIYSVQHESPQAFLIIKSKLIEVKSHLAIRSQAFSVLLDSFEGENAQP